jgi:hypothetical protein
MRLVRLLSGIQSPPRILQLQPWISKLSLRIGNSVADQDVLSVLNDSRSSLEEVARALEVFVVGLLTRRVTSRTMQISYEKPSNCYPKPSLFIVQQTNVDRSLRLIEMQGH